MGWTNLVVEASPLVAMALARVPEPAPASVSVKPGPTIGPALVIASVPLSDEIRMQRLYLDIEQILAIARSR